MRRLLTVAALLVGAAWFSGAAPAVAADPGARLKVGLNAFRDGFHDLAAKEIWAYVAAVPADPRIAEILWVLARAEIARKDWDGARDALTRLAGTADPRAQGAYYWLGWVAVQAEERQAARAHLEKYLDGPGGADRADALHLYATLARELKLPDQAAPRLEEFVAAFPHDPRAPAARLSLVQAELERNRPARAVAAVRAALADAAVGRDRVLLEALALAGVEAAAAAGDPAAEAELWGRLAKVGQEPALRARAHFEAGAAHLRGGAVAPGRQALQAYLEGAAGGAYAATAHLLLADLARTEGAAAVELQHLEAALALPADPAVAPLRTELRKAALGLALALGRRDQAETHAAALLETGKVLSPGETARARLVLAEAAAQRRELEAALGHWDAVPAGTPERRTAVLLAARALISLQRPREGLERLVPLLAEDEPTRQVQLTALAAAEAAGEVRRAADLCADLAARPPAGRSGAEFLWRRAGHLAALGEPAERGRVLERIVLEFPRDEAAAWAAEELTREAFRRRDWAGVLRWSPPGSGAAGSATGRYMAAEALYRLGRIGEARGLFQAVAGSSGPYRAQAFARLGTIADAAGDRAGAVRYYAEGLESGLDGTAAEQIRARLRELETNAGKVGD